MTPQRARRWPWVVAAVTVLAAGVLIGRLTVHSKANVRTAAVAKATTVAATPPVRRPVVVLRSDRGEQRTTTVTSMTASRALREARASYVNAHYTRAIAQARAVLRAEPASQEAWQVVGASACMTKKVALVRRAMRRLGNGARNLIRSVCSRAGVSP